MTAATVRFETLEGRTMLAASPAILMNVLESSWRLDDPGFGNTRASAFRVQLSPMMATSISGDLDTGADVDMFRVELTKGQILTADVDSRNSASDLKLTVYDASAKLVAGNDNAIDPTSGKRTNDPALLYRVPEDGAYYLRLSSNTTTSTSQAYELRVRPISLRTGSPDRELLQRTDAGMFATLNGNRLSITGPTGHGFELEGNWKQKIYDTGAKTKSKFYTSGTITLKSVGGDVPMFVPKGVNFSITTERNVWAGHFGEIASIDWTADLGFTKLASPFNRGFGLELGKLSVSQPQKAWGIRLGSDPILKNTGLPLNPAVPYLHYVDHRSLDLSFAGLSVSTAMGFSGAVVVDPADSMYISASSNEHGGVAFGLSMNGTIPFAPHARPTAFTGNVAGHIYAKLAVNIGSFDPTIPLSVDGDVFIDLDANDDGKNAGGVKLNFSKLLSDGFNTTSRVFSDIDIAANGLVRMGYTKAGFDFTFPVGECTIVYSGVEQSLFARGRTVNPFKDTILEPFGTRRDLDVDAFAKRDGTFRITANGTYTPGPYTVKGSMTLDNDGVRANGRMTALGTNINVNGAIQSNGRFSLTGTARTSLGPISGNTAFTLAKSGGAVSFRASLNSSVSTSLIGITFGGSISANVAIGVSSNGLSYSGSGRATLTVAGVTIGPEVSISNRELGIRIQVSPIIDEWLRIPLPA